MSFDKAAFEAFVASLELKHFNADELLVGRYRSKNGPPPLMLWHNIAPTIIVLDALREEFGQPFKLVSVYRTEAYNDPANNPGRVAKSQHQAFTAIDFQVSGVKPDDVKAKLLAWECDRWFYCPLSFQRKATKVSAGPIDFGELPRKVGLGSFGCWFTYRGFMKAYGVSFTHFDTRGICKSTPEL